MPSSLFSLFFGSCLLCLVTSFPSYADFNPDDVNLILYTPDGKYIRLLLGDDSTLLSFRKDREVKVIVHGFRATGQDSWVLSMKNEFNDLGYNVIVVDWGKLSGSFNYEEAKKNTVPVGGHVAEVLSWIGKKFDTPSDDFHVVGHSLGAHVAGIVGNKTTFGKLGRVTGLDVAYPRYIGEPLATRLDSEDGKFVDVIHTNGGSLTEGGMAFLSPLGHVDFYPNGGKSQPGCDTRKGNVSLQSEIYNSKASVGCSHHRAVEFFLESIKLPEVFEAVQCNNTKDYESGKCFDSERGRMGFHVSKSSKGTFYLSTRATSPYNGTEYQVTVQIDPKQAQTLGSLSVTFHTMQGKTDLAKVLDGTINGGATFNKVIAIDPEIGMDVNELVYKALPNQLEYLSVERIQIYEWEANRRYCMETIVLRSDESAFVTLYECNRK